MFAFIPIFVDQVSLLKFPFSWLNSSFNRLNQVKAPFLLIKAPFLQVKAPFLLLISPFFVAQPPSAVSQDTDTWTAGPCWIPGPTRQRRAAKLVNSWWILWFMVDSIYPGCWFQTFGLFSIYWDYPSHWNIYNPCLFVQQYETNS